jgi:XTP/dITP diphosphohydrolase
MSLVMYPDIRPAIECGTSFQENAEIKAKHYFAQIQLPVIADDSGLVVPALNGQPGIHSARYAGENATYKENNDLLLGRMALLSEKEREAYFVCVVVYFDGKTLLSSEGRAQGRIIGQAKGEKGFGYDPLFFYPPAQKTFAELTEEEKNQVSHRARALNGLKGELLKFIGNIS